MINDKMQKALNEQLNVELYSAYLYLAMAAWFQGKNLLGFAHWLEVQAKEELGHAMKFYHFLNERSGRVALKAVDAPAAEWSNPRAAFEDAYKHEQKVTGLIHGLVEKALAEKDFASEVFLEWFVTEQVEEESSTSEIVEKLKMAGDAANVLLMLDGVLGKRE